ncbi:MAG: hypothetical protein QXI39_04230 [Candidatus Bathyarchaeia archaeon]
MKLVQKLEAGAEAFRELILRGIRPEGKLVRNFHPSVRYSSSST